jgi:uncharacterized protein YcfL
MKNLLFALIFAAILFGCKSENETKETPNDTTTIVVTDETKNANDSTAIVLTEEEINIKSDELLQQSDEINKKLDDILNN